MEKTRSLPTLVQQEKQEDPLKNCLTLRLGRICSSWLLSGPADGLILLLSDVLNRIHVDSKWGMVPLCPAFTGRLSPVLYPHVCTGPPCSKWSNIWRIPNLWHLPKISLILVKPQQYLSLLTDVLCIKKPKKHQYSQSLSTISFHTHDLQIRGYPREPPLQLKQIKSGMSTCVCVWGGGGVIQWT